MLRFYIYFILYYIGMIFFVVLANYRNIIYLLNGSVLKWMIVNANNINIYIIYKTYIIYIIK